MFSLLLLSSLALADKPSVDYVNIKKGAHAPFAGVLIKKEALAKIIADHEEKVQKDKIECDYKIKRQSLDLHTKLIIKCTRT